MSKSPQDVAVPAQPCASLTDRDLVQLCIAGNQRAWAEFVTRFARLVYAIPHRHGLGDDQCDDVFQEVFAIVVNQLAELRDVSSLPKWLITLAQRVTWRHVREQTRSANIEQGLPRHEQAPDEEVMQLERQHVVRTALRRLGGRCEELLTALYLGNERPDYAQISQRLNMPVGGIGPTRARCLQKLLAILREMGLEQ